MNNMETIDMAGWTGEDVKRHVKATRYGFVTSKELSIVAEDSRTRLELILIRCGGGRFMCPAQDVKHFIGIIEQHMRLIELLNKWGEAGQAESFDIMDEIIGLVGDAKGDHVRDVCFPAGS